MIHLVLVVVTTGPDIVVMVFMHPKTEEQKLVRDRVLVFALTIAFEQDEISDWEQGGLAEYAVFTRATAAKAVQ